MELDLDLEKPGKLLKGFRRMTSLPSSVITIVIIITISTKVNLYGAYSVPCILLCTVHALSLVILLTAHTGKYNIYFIPKLVILEMHLLITELKFGTECHHLQQCCP